MAQATEGSAYLDETGLARVAENAKKSIAVNNPDVSNVKIVSNSTEAIELTWVDPNNEDWAGTMIRRKMNTPPVDETDGELVGNLTVKNQHITEPYVDPNAGPASEATYYYRFFPYTLDGVYSAQGASYEKQVKLSIVPWSTGSINGIKAMLDAHHAGVIDVRDYWSVGDEREDSNGIIHVLADDTDNGLTLTKDDKESVRTKAAFTVLLKNYKPLATRGIAKAYSVAPKTPNYGYNTSLNATGRFVYASTDQNLPAYTKYNETINFPVKAPVEYTGSPVYTQSLNALEAIGEEMLDIYRNVSVTYNRINSSTTIPSDGTSLSNTYFKTTFDQRAGTYKDMTITIAITGSVSNVSLNTKFTVPSVENIDGTNRLKYLTNSMISSLKTNGASIATLNLSGGNGRLDDLTANVYLNTSSYFQYTFSIYGVDYCGSYNSYVKVHNGSGITTQGNDANVTCIFLGAI